MCKWFWSVLNLRITFWVVMVYLGMREFGWFFEEWTINSKSWYWAYFKGFCGYNGGLVIFSEKLFLRLKLIIFYALGALFMVDYFLSCWLFSTAATFLMRGTFSEIGWHFLKIEAVVFMINLILVESTFWSMLTFLKIMTQLLNLGHYFSLRRFFIDQD